jgi:hypothetical protein
MRRMTLGLLVILAVAGCTKEEASAELGAVKKANEVAAQASAHANVGAVDEIGVPECDSYIKNYETCLTEKVPAAEQQSFRAKLEAQRRQWHQAAADPSGRDSLVQDCRMSTALAKQSMAKYGCEF